MGEIRFCGLVGLLRGAFRQAFSDSGRRNIRFLRQGAWILKVVFVWGSLASLLLVEEAPPTQGERAVQTEASSYSSYLHSTLSSVNYWESRLEDEENLTGIDRQVVKDSLLEGLTWLCEVGKLPQALPRIRKTLSEKRPQLLRFGFDGSGFYSANLTRLKLENPIFENYTVFLLRLENRSPFELVLEKPALTIFLTSGIPVSQVTLTDSHPLYPHLYRIAGSFFFPKKVSPGSVISVKAIFDGRITEDKISYALVSFSGFNLAIKYYENTIESEVK